MNWTQQEPSESVKRLALYGKTEEAKQQREAQVEDATAELRAMHKQSPWEGDPFEDGNVPAYVALYIGHDNYADMNGTERGSYELAQVVNVDSDEARMRQVGDLANSLIELEFHVYLYLTNDADGLSDYAHLTPELVARIDDGLRIDENGVLE